MSGLILWRGNQTQLITWVKFKWAGDLSWAVKRPDR